MIRILHLDDVSEESGLIDIILRKSGLKYELAWVANKEEYVRALDDFNPDVVLSDHSMPSFTSIQAFRILRERNLEIPFILLTATVSEEFAVSMMREGIADYILKDRPQRLPAAIENALDKFEAERRNKEFIAKIIRSEANLKAVMENSNVNIYSLDRSFRYVTFNKLLKDTLKMYYGLDIKPGDIVFEFLSKYDPKEVDAWRDIYMRALQGESIQFTKEFDINGVRAFVAFYVNPVIEDGMVTGLSCFATDFTKEKLAEENIARSEARFRALIDNNFDAIIVTGEDRILSYASPSTFRMLGYSWDEMKVNATETFSHPDEAQSVSQLYNLVYNNPGMPVPWTIRARHRDGHYIWAEGVITNMLENQNVRGIVSNFRDVTERKEAEIQQAQMTRDLTQRNKDLEQFAYIVSHNLRGPVANILGIANILKYEEFGSEERQEAQQRIFDATEKLDEVIHDLNRILDLKQEVNDKKEGVDLQELVDGIMVSIENLIVRNNVRIVTDFTRVHSISTIRSYLQSIFYNLISNSIKYKRPDIDPVIRITSSEGTSEDQVRLVFTDNGLGIDLEAAGSKVFGLYKRFHPLHAEGKGMGLFMVKTQVESLGGEISIKSEVNKGTEFTIEL